MASVAHLRRLIRQADAAYRNGCPLMTDAAYDQLLNDLRAVAPHAPELHTHTPSAATTASRNPAMLSLNNVRALSPTSPYPEEDVLRWYQTIPGENRPLGDDHTCQLTVQPKIDGVAIGLTYTNGHLTAARTRSGKCAMHLLTLGDIIPKQLSCMDPVGAGSRTAVKQRTTHPTTLDVYGELWSADMKQSTAAAALRATSPNIDLLNFTAYALGDPVHALSGDPSTPPIPSNYPSPYNNPDEFTLISCLELWGFEAPCTYLCTKLSQVRHLFLQWYEGHLYANYPTDGIVIRPANIRDRLLMGTSRTAPNGILAIKR